MRTEKEVLEDFKELGWNGCLIEYGEIVALYNINKNTKINFNHGQKSYRANTQLNQDEISLLYELFEIWG